MVQYIVLYPPRNGITADDLKDMTDEIACSFILRISAMVGIMHHGGADTAHANGHDQPECKEANIMSCCETGYNAHIRSEIQQQHHGCLHPHFGIGIRTH